MMRIPPGHLVPSIGRQIDMYTELRTEAVVKIFLPPFGCDLVRPPYVVIDSKLFSITLSFYFREIL